MLLYRSVSRIHFVTLSWPVFSTAGSKLGDPSLDTWYNKFLKSTSQIGGLVVLGCSELISLLWYENRYYRIFSSLRPGN